MGEAHFDEGLFLQHGGARQLAFLLIFGGFLFVLLATALRGFFRLARFGCSFARFRARPSVGPTRR